MPLLDTVARFDVSASLDRSGESLKWTLGTLAPAEEAQNTLRFSQIGHGVYTLAEAERLVRVPRNRIRRWTHGYTYRTNGHEQHSPPLIGAETARFTDVPAINFSDLIEVRFLNAFRKHGVGWKAIRIAADRAKEHLGLSRPFSSQRFKTDGITILAEIVQKTGDRLLLDLVRNQYAFQSVISEYLYEGLDFDDLLEPERWWPLGKDRSVVIDPARAFGTPIVSESGVPTSILSNALAAEGSVNLVAHWYDVSENEVTDAAEYEARLAA